jgi:hypothetical protein
LGVREVAMLDDLRRDSFDDDFDFDDDDELIDLPEREGRDRYFLGMRPVERMMLMIFLFMNVCVIMLALLLATGRLVL